MEGIYIYILIVKENCSTSLLLLPNNVCLNIVFEPTAIWGMAQYSKRYLNELFPGLQGSDVVRANS